MEVVGPISPPEAAERTGLTEAGARRALARLAKTGFVRRIGGGRSRQYALREEDGISLKLTQLFREERERFDALLSAIRASFKDLGEIRYAWMDHLPREIGHPLEVRFIGGTESLTWLSEEVQRRLVKAEKAFDLMIEVQAFSLADAPSPGSESPIILAGVSPHANPEPARAPKTHRDRDRRALNLSRAIAELLMENPSLIRRALQHIERILREDKGSATHALEEWRAILSNYSLERVREFLVAQTPRAQRLRQSSPFFAVLKPEERDSVLEYLETEE